MDAAERQVLEVATIATAIGGSGRASIVGMVVGGMVSAVPAAWGALDASWALMMVGGLVGIPIGLILGARFGAEARTTDGPRALGLAAKMAVLAVLIGDLVVGGVMTLGMASSGVGGVLIGLLGTVIGLLMLGLPALVLTVPCAITWLLVMRLLPERLLRDGRSPITSWSRRLPAVAVIVALASIGAVPFALAATDGRFCPDLTGREVGSMAWSADGERLVVETWDWDSERSILFEVQPDDRTVRVFHEVAGAVNAMVVDPSGTTWWTLEDASGIALWSATSTGAPVRHGSIAVASMSDAYYDMGGLGLWWIDGGLAMDTWDQGAIRLEPGAGETLVGDPVQPDESNRNGSPISASVDGTVVGWSEYGSESDQAVWNVSMVVVEDGKRRDVRLPGDTYDAALSSDGRAAIVLTDAGWLIAPLDGSATTFLMGEDWTRPSVMGDRAAATRTGFRGGELCFQSLATTP